MGFSLKKAIKHPSRFATAFATGGLSELLGQGSKGTPNPYGPPDMNSIFDPSQFNFLKTYTPETYKPSATAYGSSDAGFQDLISSINGTGAAGHDYMGELLKGIDQDTGQAVANTKLDFMDRGLGGAGLFSDLEGAGVGQAEATGAQTKSGLRSQFALNQANNLQSAYNSRYGNLFSRDTQGAQDMFSDFETDKATRASRDTTLAGILAQMASGKAANLTQLFDAGQQNNSDTKKNPIWEDILRNTKINLNPVTGNGG